MGRRLATAALAALLLGLSGLPALATTTTVTVVDFAFSPKAVTIRQGDAVQWQNTGVRTHTATQDAPLSLFATGNISPGTTSVAKVLTAAGGYPYHCSIHPTMVGSIKVPVKVAPTSGTTATVFTITAATRAAPSGFVYDVQEKVGDTGSWAAFETGVTTASVTFQATSAGSYAFRSLLRRVSTGAKSKPSPARTVTVA
jgi:plastocyanin